MTHYISAKLGYDYFNIDKIKDMKKEEARSYLRNGMGLSLKSLLLYFDEEDKLKDNTFRQVTCVGDKYEIVSYPLLINKLLKAGSIDIREYTYKKFERVNAFLAGIDRLNDDNDNKEQVEI
ncbi:MAG: hypothetical protein ACI8WT_001560 [Clostridium sp.]